MALVFYKENISGLVEIWSLIDIIVISDALCLDL